MANVHPYWKGLTELIHNFHALLSQKTEAVLVDCYEYS